MFCFSGIASPCTNPILATPSSGHIWPNSISLHFRSKLSCVIALLCILRHHCRNYFVFARHFRSCTLIISRFPQRYLCFINCAESVSLLLKGKLLGYDLTASFVLFWRPPVEANSMEPESANPHAAWRKNNNSLKLHTTTAITTSQIIWIFVAQTNHHFY